MNRVRLSPESYTVGWICAIPIEKAAAIAMLDGPPHETPQLPPHDWNSYTLGQIGVHNVVIACMPSGVYGTTSAAIVADSMMRTFTSLRFGLMVGVGGGVPSPMADIRLGDVVVSKPSYHLGGVVQYDYGKTVSGGRFVRTGSLDKPPPVLLNAMSNVQAKHILGNNQMQKYISQTLWQFPEQFAFPGSDCDNLFESKYDHPTGLDTCMHCDRRKCITRPSRGGDAPMVHYGLIASANQVMKNGRMRDRLGRELGVICFEMEAAGLMDSFRCLIIRGICDYSDSHKNKEWQPYAAATAAAYAKELLSAIHGHEIARTDVIGTKSGSCLWPTD